MKLQTRKRSKQFLYSRRNPKKSRNIYTNNNPHNTIPIRYTTLQDVRNTIFRLERLFKQKRYSHQRISQVGLILKVRLEILKEKKPEEYALANRYLEFLKQRTAVSESERYGLNFSFDRILK